MKHVDYLRVKDIDLQISSAKKIKSDLDKSIESLDPADDSFIVAAFTRCSTAVSNKTKSGSRNSCLVDIKPSVEELDDFCKTVGDCKIKPVCLSLEEPYAASFIFQTRDVISILDLFDPKYLELDYITLLRECHHVRIDVTDKQIKLIEKSTVEQSKGNAFFRHCSGRIGASKC